MISTHTLRVERDMQYSMDTFLQTQISTHTLRVERDRKYLDDIKVADISTHTLRVERDWINLF